MDNIYDDNPEWLQKNIINDTFRWNESFTTTFDEFLAHVTFHDSYWIGSFINQEMQHICIIRLDAFWNEKYSQCEKYNKDWHFCLIKIQNVISIRLKKIEEDQTNTIRHCENEIIDNMAITQFDDIYGGSLEITHEPPIKILLVTQEGEYLNPNPTIL